MRKAVAWFVRHKEQGTTLSRPTWSRGSSEGTRTDLSKLRATDGFSARDWFELSPKERKDRIAAAWETMEVVALREE